MPERSTFWRRARSRVTTLPDDQSGEVLRRHLRILEALLFASAEPLRIPEMAPYFGEETDITGLLEVLAPYKAAVHSLLRSASHRPSLALALNGMALRSQHWMLTAAGIGTHGPRGALRVQGAAMLFGRVLAVWVNDEEPGLDRTMAALDRGLASAERWSGFVDDLLCIPAVLCRGFRPRRRARDFDQPEAA